MRKASPEVALVCDTGTVVEEVLLGGSECRPVGRGFASLRGMRQLFKRGKLGFTPWTLWLNGERESY